MAVEQRDPRQARQWRQEVARCAEQLAMALAAEGREQMLAPVEARFAQLAGAVEAAMRAGHELAAAPVGKRGRAVEEERFLLLIPQAEQLAGV